jgi:hypothetical protein
MSKERALEKILDEKISTMAFSCFDKKCSTERDTGRAKGYKIVMYLDDGIGGAES